jgi:hypothetical protein
MTNQNATSGRWLLEWKDRDPYRRIWESADSIEETRAAIESILEAVTWTPEDAEELGGDETELAYGAFVREEFDGDIAKGLADLRHGRIVFACDDGTLTIERER